MVKTNLEFFDIKKNKPQTNSQHHVYLVTMVL